MSQQKKLLAAAIALATASTVNANELVLEEIIVVARKREQSVQDVSVAVSVATSEMLRNAQIIQSSELTEVIPSLTFQQGNSSRSSSFNIRGIGTRSYSSGVEPSVSVMVDGVVMGRAGMSAMNLLDVERVEVLRGPQGTLFGKNSSGGVVHIISKRPTDEFEAEFMLAADDGGEQRAGFTVSGAATDDLRLRLTGFGLNRDGYVENVHTGEDMNYEESWNLKGRMLWDINDQIEMSWITDISDTRGDCCVATVRSDNPEPMDYPFGIPQYISEMIAPAVPSKTNNQVNDEADYYSNFTNRGNAVEFNIDLGSHTLTSITAYREWEAEESQGEGLPPVLGVISFLDINAGESDQNQFSQELRIASNGDGRLQYVAGLFYWNQELDRNFERSLFNLGSLSYDHGLFEASIESEHLGVFGQATYDITDTVRALFGGRYTDEELKYDFSRTGWMPDSGSDKATDTDFSGMLGLEWDASDQILLYATATEGYKGVAFNVLYEMESDTTEVVDPETSLAFEVGMKANWLDNRLITNLAIFHTAYDDYQAEAYTVLPGEAPKKFLVNAGEVSTQGVELDFQYLVLEGLILTGGVAYVDATLDTFENAPCDATEDCVFKDVSGGDMPNSPDWKANVGAVYDIALNSMPFDLTLGGNYSWRDENQFSIGQDSGKVQDAYGMLNISATMQAKSGHWDAKLYVNNATDESYASFIFDTLGYVGSYSQILPRGAERIMGAELRYRF